MHRGEQLRRLLLRTGGSYVALAEAGRLHHGPAGGGPHPAAAAGTSGAPMLLLLPRGAPAACDAAAGPTATPTRGYTTTSKKKKRGRGAVVDDSAGVPATIDLNKALGDMKEASEAAGGALKRDEALALAALLAREVVKEQTGGGGGDRANPRLKSTLVSPPLSAMRTRERARRFLEYATLCENVYDLPDDKDWQAPPAALGPVGGWKLLASHPGGVCIPRYVVLRMDGGAGVRGRRRTRRLLVVVRGTADVTDAAINIAMTPGSFTHQGQEHQCHKGIVEAAAFLERMVRPVIWRELDALRAEGVDPGHEVEVIFTGHSLGAATAAIAALELQGEFGPRVPVRSVGFSTPASLSEGIAASPLTRRICTTVVLGDDIIPRCSTKNLQDLKRKAQSVTVDAEVERITTMVKQDLARRSDEWSRQLAGMLKAKASEAQRAVTPNLPALPSLALPPGPVDVGGLKAALGGVLAGLLPQGQGQGQGKQQAPQPPEQLAAGTEEVAMAAAVEGALREYQETLDAEIEYVKDQLERLKREALEPLMPSSSEQAPSPSSPAPKARAGSGDGEDDEDDDDDEDEEKAEAALFAANAALAATRRALDPEAVQKALQQLLGERASAAASVTAEAEARVRALLTETTKGVEEVKGKAAATVSWVKDSLQSLQRQARAVLPSAHSSSFYSSPPEQQQEAAPSSTAPPLEGPGVAATEFVDDTMDVDATFHEDTPGVALYPPGEIFWIRPLRTTTEAAGEGAAAGGSGGSSSRRGGGGGDGSGEGYELRRVRDVRFFDGIVLSPHMFTHHLMTSVMAALDEAKTAGVQGRK